MCPGMKTRPSLGRLVHVSNRIQQVTREIENLVTGERHQIEWGGVRLTIDPSQDPALLFRCFA